MDSVTPAAPSVADRIIKKFGGLSKLAQALGHKNPTTVQGWRERGYIPIQNIPAVRAAAERAGIDVDPTEFIPEPDAGEAA